MRRIFYNASVALLMFSDFDRRAQAYVARGPYHDAKDSASRSQRPCVVGGSLASARRLSDRKNRLGLIAGRYTPTHTPAQTQEITMVAPFLSPMRRKTALF